MATVQVPFVQGGAEAHARELCNAITRAGHQAEIISVPFKWYPPERIPEQMLACRLLDVTASSGARIDRLIGLKFPAYLMRHPEKALWILHQHRPAYDLWDSPYGDMKGAAHGERVRDLIRAADTRLIPEAQRIYTNSRNVSARLKSSCGIVADPLYHPPPAAERYVGGPYGDYFLMPSRINAMKRQDLVVEALFHVKSDIRVAFIGSVDSLELSESLRRRAAALPAGRVQWLGHVPLDRKLELTANCRAVIYPPYDEDYGYVTLEAMLASRPVITVTDAGGPLELVTNGETGLVVPPEPSALAAALDRLAADAALARRLGEAGRARYDSLNIGWDRVLQCLIG